MRKRNLAGLTLIELMITIAVLSIVISIGFPMYEKQVRKANRADARGAIMRLALAQEQYYAMYSQYATDASHDEAVKLLNYGPDKLKDGNDDSYAYDKAMADMNGTKYRLVIGSDGDANTDDFTITVTGIGSQLGDEECRKFSIDQTGTKLAEDKGGNDATGKCW
jgi:type IV pilus assembly protein PilE